MRFQVLLSLDLGVGQTADFPTVKQSPALVVKTLVEAHHVADPTEVNESVADIAQVL